MKTVLLTTVLLLIAASSTSAKLKVKVGIETLGEGGSNLESSLRESVEARINSTDRYVLTTNAGEADLVIEFTCVVMRPAVEIACTSDVTYFPYKDSSLYISVDKADRIASGDTSFVTESLMNRFFNSTTDSTLAERKQFLRHGVQLLCANHPEECKL
jgi:hypothetical protein